MPLEPLISIVDDDDAVCEATKSLMRSLGFVAETFHRAEDFLISELVDRTACLIVDVQMPGLSGLDLYRRLVASGKFIPTILITAYPDEGVRMRALNAGVLSYLIKPFSESELLKCLHAVLPSTQRGP